MTDFIDRPEYHIPDDGKHHHPAADSAMLWLNHIMTDHPHKWAIIKESVFSTALSGNETANYCAGTIRRLEAGEGVSDRYLLGLAWVVREMANQPEVNEVRDEEI